MGILQSLFMCMGDKNVNEEGIRRIISNCWKIQLRNRKRLSMNKIHDIQELENILKAHNSCCKSET